LRDGELRHEVFQLFRASLSANDAKRAAQQHSTEREPHPAVFRNAPAPARGEGA
jgi:hypothetical protein